MSDPISRQASRSYDLYITISVCTFALVTTTVLRIAAKVKYRLSLGWDDYFIILGTCLNVVANGFNFQATASGFGRHAQFLTFDQLVKAEKYAQIAVIVAAIAIWAVKISICFFLLAIIKGTHAYFVWFIRIIMGFTTASQFVVSLLWGLQAKPLPKLWDPRIPGTRDSAKGFLVVIYIYYGNCLRHPTPTTSFRELD
ncbi:MAG: hypothetical protein ALECFALPRED_005123 [Alectoria fallacina]|uniref:Rhodopsin domain-containing protein n=1 Tax=Alectoria fallacina TaxID=1903189 RepID=A0A8H3FVM3_9LECA|nr:MAG: hypothetical protein ALECFALPRED_005123 [Alectoria fallacina]